MLCYLCCFLPVILLDTHLTKLIFSWAVLIWRKTTSLVNLLEKITLQDARNLARRLVTYADSLVWRRSFLLQDCDCKTFYQLLLQLRIPPTHGAWWDYIWVKPTLVLVLVKSEYFNNLCLTVRKFFFHICAVKAIKKGIMRRFVCLVALFQGCTLRPVCSVSRVNWKRISIRHLCCLDPTN